MASVYSHIFFPSIRLLRQNFHRKVQMKGESARVDISRLLRMKDVQQVKSLVCVQPHPDDNEVGAGGLVATLAHQGCRIVFVTVTDGRYGSSDPSLSPGALVEIRRQERLHAGQCLGVVEQVELGFEDGGKYEERDVMEALLPVLRRVGPEMVMTVDPWVPYEAHPDHQKVGRATAAAVLFAGNISYPHAGAPCHIPQVAFYASSYPNTFVDVTPYWKVKMSAILAHWSQFDNEQWPLLQQYFEYQASEYYRLLQSRASLDEVDGAPTQVGFAEAFKVLSTKQLHFFPTAVFS
ncbi:PIG-L family deacetylase [Alicyclobacillus fastidiosus]|uniref:PIG-L family deacetylase n=1 Tax=Alicyclobacillus fastidiosus TaxID=392011 RepID=A0ABY6ZDM8_9BACL|nr:PIG-L deacetylase family protein [Alicyclobacillus fastidiosus]WAH40235.1 PIG-L family deacetylase [Alicyclobacillus fastidiosus]GMA61598.1 diacetylchitobiose deacetylase [Alicyclobacillus fastidiosus]